MSEIAIINPATEKIFKKYSVMDKKKVKKIIQSVHEAQKEWALTSFSFRSKCLFNIVKLLDKNKKDYATLMTNEMGKPIIQSIAEIEKCKKLFEYYALEGKNFLASETIKTEFYKSYRSFQPLGIIFAIMPWNFPFWQVMRFAAPNITLGNAGILKHASNSMGTALAIEKLFLEAGFPKNLFRSLIINVDLVPFVIEHPFVSGITLTGSNKAGQFVAKEAGAVFKKVVLELGGNDPYVILDDADLELAAEQCVLSRFGINTGQSCIAAKRLIVLKKVKNTFQDMIIEKAKKYKMGDPLDPKTHLGPLARKDLQIKLHKQVQQSIKKGAHCISGGKLLKETGYFYPPTILFDVPSDSPAFLEELFGPVISVMGAKNNREAFLLANNTSFGLGGAVFTRNLKKGEAFAKYKMDVGTCAVNTYVSSDPRLPFGGIKQSGYGRELSLEGMREFANIKTIIISNK